MIFEMLLVTLGRSDLILAVENKGLRDVDFRFLQFAILHMIYKAYSIFAKVKKRDADSLCQASREAPKVVPGPIWELANHCFHKGSSASFSTFVKMRFCICFIMVISLLQECKIDIRKPYET